MAARLEATTPAVERWVLTFHLGSSEATDLFIEFSPPQTAPAPVQFLLRANRSQDFAPFLQALSKAANLRPGGAEVRAVDSLPIPADYLGRSMGWSEGTEPSQASFTLDPSGPWEVYDLRFRPGGGGRLLLGLDRARGKALLVPPFVTSEEEEISVVVIKFALLGLWLPAR